MGGKMTNLEQAERLKKAGFPLKEVTKGEYENPTEKELMEWLARKIRLHIMYCSIEQIWLVYHGVLKLKLVAKHPDLTESLVLAVEAVLKEGK
jgi:hypothetical protein